LEPTQETSAAVSANSAVDAELVEKLKAEHAAELVALTGQLESKHTAFVDKLTSQHQDKLASAVAEIESQHKKAQSLWSTKQNEMEQHIQRFNQEATEAAVNAANQLHEVQIGKLKAKFQKEKESLAEQQRVSDQLSADKIANLRDEYEGKLSSLQAQLSANADGGDQVEAVTAEFNKQIETLRATLVEKDEHISTVEAKLKHTLDKHDTELTELQGTMDRIYEEMAIFKAKSEKYEAEKAVAVAQQSDADSVELNETRSQLEAARQAVQASEAELAQVRAQLASKENDVNTLLADLVKVKEALAERERALETATKSLSEQHKLNHDYAQKVSDLAAEIAEKDARSRQTQSNTAEEEENKKLLISYREQLKEQGERLAAFEKEGQSLARKQSEMEKVVRKSKGELRDKDNEIQKLKDSKEQLVKAIEQTQDVLKKHEMETANASKNLTAMQAVSQASTDKLVRLEAELTAKTEELASQRRALEAAWAEVTELKRNLTELKADRDDLRKRIGEGTSKAMETESSRRDIEKREAVLRATNSQLQDNLQRQMAEAAVREERLREEVNEMRKRWQEAIGNRESMASELGNVTAPLLRQISSLQESVRVKSEHWQNVESSLSERALRAENAAEIAEHKRSLIEEQMVELKQLHSTNSSRLAEYQSQLATAEASIERLKKREALWAEEKAELDSRLAMEIAQRQSLQSSLREIEIRHKVEVQELQDNAVLLRNQNELELSMCAKDMDLLREELALAKANSGTYGALTAGSPLNKNKLSHGSKLSLHGLNGSRVPRAGSLDRMQSGGGATEAGESSLGSDSSEAAHSYAMGAEQLASTSLPNGEVTFAAAEKLQQRSRQRDDDMHALTLQIQRLEASRNALLEEVSYLSMRNSQLEEQSASVPHLQSELEAHKKRLELVLVLLGEKDEELEAMMSDMQEVKHMYRAHLEELIETSISPTAAKNGAKGGDAGYSVGYDLSREEELTSIDLGDEATTQKQ